MTGDSSVDAANASMEQRSTSAGLAMSKHLKGEEWDYEEACALEVFKRTSGLDFTLRSHFRKNTRYVTYSSSSGPVSDKFISIKSRVTSRMLRSHFQGEITLALPRFRNSRVVPIDIDDHTDKRDRPNVQLVKDLVKIIGEPFYIEYNPQSNGYHLYYEFTEYLSDGCLRALETEMSGKTEGGGQIEVITGHKSIRGPWSAEYSYRGQYDPSFHYLINPINTIAQLARVFEDHEFPPVPSLLRKWNTSGTSVSPERSERVRTTSKNNAQDFTYGAGTRHIQQFRLALSMQKQGRSDFDEFCTLCEKFNDGTSKDMMRPYDRKLAIMRDCWNGATKRLDTESESGERVNSVGSIKWETDVFNEDDRSVLMSLSAYAALKFGLVKKPLGKIHATTTRSIVRLLMGIAQIRKYRSENEYRYRERKMHWANDSVPLGKEFLRKAANNMGVKNPERILKFLVKAGFLYQLTNPRTGYPSSRKVLRYCSHYKLNDPQQLRSLYSGLFGDEFHELAKLVANDSVDEPEFSVPPGGALNIDQISNIAGLLEGKDTRGVLINKLDSYFYTSQQERGKIESRADLHDRHLKERLEKVREKQLEFHSRRTLNAGTENSLRTTQPAA